ncbi:hypothetical protein HKB23_12795, partial [Vibrio parahaemolyticus]|nr:hypothetical protein [Vibrio parahaemolyticus]
AGARDPPGHAGRSLGRGEGGHPRHAPGDGGDGVRESMVDSQWSMVGSQTLPHARSRWVVVSGV